MQMRAILATCLMVAVAACSGNNPTSGAVGPSRATDERLGHEPLGDPSPGIQHLPDLAGKPLGRERLLEKRNPWLEHPVLYDGIVGVA